MVCKENGGGKRFICQTCGFDMHEFCALAPRSLHNHPFHLEHQLDFSVQTGESRRTKCDICGKTARGYSFRCNTCEFEMHPCCATMSSQMSFPTHQHVLYLSNLNDEASFLCQICRRKRPGQVYQCNACRYYLHAVCAKNFVNGLYIQGVVPPEKGDSIGKIARVAFNLVLKAIGGLIEGIGEGIGESLVGGIGKGIRCGRIKNKKSSDM
ncbi:hypothetical protein LUZ63_002338 [Rhynchospora breviuscula]|uniref:Phorbol-ester/DAG-type domain-containing protein n=1 Tax=Rhynchospora breviuscula TaxID=2022672 RepID=A0A9Q0CZX1_9POAL|nr:hypothetical protein LUZ63_002338 [Rhynchospora breviuscula]